MLALESPSCWMVVKAAVLSFAYHANLVPENVRKAAYSFCTFCRS